MENVNNAALSKKLKKVLTTFLVPKCRINNDVYLEMLLTHLSGKFNSCTCNV